MYDFIYKYFLLFNLFYFAAQFLATKAYAAVFLRMSKNYKKNCFKAVS